MRALLLGALLSGCLTRPAFEPVGGFELVLAPDRGEWSELGARELENWLAAAHSALQPVADYSATLETRERIEDALHPRRVLALRVAERPFRVAAETLEPPAEKGQRVWYDASLRGGSLRARTPGFLGSLVGTVTLDPKGDLAMENRRHPITDIGLGRLLEQIEEGFGPSLRHRPAPRIRSVETSLAGRPGRLVEALVSREPPDSALVHRFGFDDVSGLLVYYGLAELLPDGPALVEEYLYRDVCTNLGFPAEVFRPGSGD